MCARAGARVCVCLCASSLCVQVAQVEDITVVWKALLVLVRVSRTICFIQRFSSIVGASMPTQNYI